MNLKQRKIMQPQRTGMARLSPFNVARIAVSSAGAWMTPQLPALR